jgi:hypothetical protein
MVGVRGSARVWPLTLMMRMVCVQDDYRADVLAVCQSLQQLVACQRDAAIRASISGGDSAAASIGALELEGEAGMSMEDLLLTQSVLCASLAQPASTPGSAPRGLLGTSLRVSSEGRDPFACAGVDAEDDRETWLVSHDDVTEAGGNLGGSEVRVVEAKGGLEVNSWGTYREDSDLELEYV